MIRFVWGLLAAGWVLAPIAAQAAEPLVLEPSTQWVMDYAEESCALKREFGQSYTRMLLEMRGYSRGNQFEVSLVTPSLRLANDRIRMTILPDDRHSEVSAEQLAAEGLRGVRFTATTEPPAWREASEHLPPGQPWPKMRESDRDLREAQITGILVEGAFEQSVQLATGSLSAPLAAMRTCLDDLVTGWGYDVAALESLARGTRPLNQREFARTLLEMHAKRAVDRRARVRLRMRLDVSAEGRAIGCHIQNRVNDSGLADAVCSTALKHARFEPALDAEGKPAPGYFVTTIAFFEK